MKVGELISALKEFPPDADVRVMYDGGAREHAELVWMARNDKVVLSSYGEPVYDDCDRPENAPTAEEDKFWHTQDDPNEP